MFFFPTGGVQEAEVTVDREGASGWVLAEWMLVLVLANCSFSFCWNETVATSHECILLCLIVCDVSKQQSRACRRTLFAQSMKKMKMIA